MIRLASPPALCSTATGWAVPVAAAAIALSGRFSATPCALAGATANSERIRPSVPNNSANFRFILNSPRVNNGRPDGSAWCSARWGRFHFAPDEIDGNAEQYDHEPRQSLGGRLVRDQQDHRDCRRENDV